MQEFDFILLLQKQFNGEITSDESAVLDALLKQSPQNEQFAAEYRRVWDEASETRPHDFRLDMDAEFRRLMAGIETAERRTPAKTVSISRLLLRVAAAVAVLVAATWGYRQFTMPVSEQIVAQVREDGAVRQIVLPDGSNVWLRQNSEIKYPKQFASDERRVQLSGEAYFDVAHRGDQPFRIGLAGGGEVEVLGTAFDVRDFSDSDETSVLVRSGKVRYAPAGKTTSIVLSANDRAAFSRKNARLTRSKVPTLNELAWQTGRLEFDDTPLRHVMADLEKHYGATIEIENRNMLDCSYSNTLTNQTLDDVLESFALIYNFRVIRPAPGRFRLSGGRCN
ncbi:MAG: FecR domain-containing protein [Saprospiraceae bacterium]|jgi:transmembrane sensor|nr:FecR domain-containing protein [Saprospiraceae bacterium]